MREATLKTRGVQAREELSTAKHNVEDCRKNMEYAKEQVSVVVFGFWLLLFNKMGRGGVEFWHSDLFTLQ